MDKPTEANNSSDFLNLILQDGLAESLPRIVESLLNAAMLIERSQHLKASPHQRNPERNGHANGFKPRHYQTSFGSLDLSIPQVRNSDRPFRTQVLEQGSRSERALKSAIATMYLQGVTTRRVTKVMEQLCGFEVSSTQVSKLTAQLDTEFEQWRNRPLPEIRYLTLDATYYKVRIDGSVRDCATLKAIGVRREDGKRMILGVSCALSEAEVHWREFLSSLKERGIGIPDLVTSDAHEGLKAALKTSLNATPWQRCQFHLQQNAGHHLTKQDLRQPVAHDIRHIFQSRDLPEAEERLKAFVVKYQKSQPKLALWAEENLPEGFTVFQIPEAHRKRLRTSNSCETLNSQIKRRTRVAGLFPNEESLLRLVTAVLIEISEEWETGKAYLNFKPQN